jgi:hypothetical protein
VTQLDSQRAGRRWRRGRALLDRVQTSQSPSSSTWQGNADPGRSHRPSLAESDGPLRTSADDMWLLTHGLRGRRGSCEPRCLRPFAARRGCSARRHVTACPTTAESERWVGHGSRIARTRGGFAGFAFSLLPRDADRSCAHGSSLPKLFHFHAPKCGDASVPGGRDRCVSTNPIGDSNGGVATRPGARGNHFLRGPVETGSTARVQHDQTCAWHLPADRRAPPRPQACRLRRSACVTRDAARGYVYRIGIRSNGAASTSKRSYQRPTRRGASGR